MDFRCVLTFLATVFERSVRTPVLSSSRIVPSGSSLLVAVVIVTRSLRAHNDDKASPRNPNVVTVLSSSNEESLDV